MRYASRKFLLALLSILSADVLIYTGSLHGGGVVGRRGLRARAVHGR